MALDTDARSGAPVRAEPNPEIGFDEDAVWVENVVVLAGTGIAVLLACTLGVLMYWA